jgi:RecB family exonuclease
MAAALPRTTPLELETELTASLDVAGRTYLLGGRADRVDRREEGVVIVDYKTGSVPAVPAGSWTDEPFFRRLAAGRDGADDADLLEAAARRFPSLQLPLYCWLYAAGRGETPADAVFVELREKGEEKPLFGPRFEADARKDCIRRGIADLLAFLLRHLATAKSFAPRPDERRCAYCDFRPACGAAKR